MNNPKNRQAGKRTVPSGFIDTPAIPVQVSRNIVVASIQVDLDDRVLARFQEDLLQRIHNSNSTGVILDLSALETLDSEEFIALRHIISASRIMGAESVLVGLKPGVVSSLIETGVDVAGLHAAIDLDTAYSELESRTSSDDGQIQGPESEMEMGIEMEPLADQSLEPVSFNKGSGIER